MMAVTNGTAAVAIFSRSTSGQSLRMSFEVQVGLSDFPRPEVLRKVKKVSN